MRTQTVKSIMAIIGSLTFAWGLLLVGSVNGHQYRGISIFALAVGLAFVLQWLAFVPAYLFSTEKFFDLMGGIGFVSVISLSLAMAPQRDARAWLLWALVFIWAARLSVFLFLRIRSSGEDRRFRAIKKSFWRFLTTWTIQGLWVSFTLAAALAAITSTTLRPLSWFENLGILLWVFGFALETISDWQKSVFKKDPKNKDAFIQKGLWAWSRHPNYFGEVVLWLGVSFIAAPVLQGWQWVTMISPVFIYLLLTRVSGIPMLEQYADEKWGGQDNYEQYKTKTPAFFPKAPK